MLCCRRIYNMKWLNIYICQCGVMFGLHASSKSHEFYFKVNQKLIFIKSVHKWAVFSHDKQKREVFLLSKLRHSLHRPFKTLLCTLYISYEHHWTMCAFQRLSDKHNIYTEHQKLSVLSLSSTWAHTTQYGESWNS